MVKTWFRYPANQLRLVVYPMIYRIVLNPRWLFGIPEPSTVATKNGGFQVRNLLFLGSIFRGYDVSFREGRKKGFDVYLLKIEESSNFASLGHAKRFWASQTILGK